MAPRSLIAVQYAVSLRVNAGAEIAQNANSEGDPSGYGQQLTHARRMLIPNQANSVEGQAEPLPVKVMQIPADWCGRAPKRGATFRTRGGHPGLPVVFAQEATRTHPVDAPHQRLADGASVVVSAIR